MSAVVERAVSWAVSIAQDDSHGYSQNKRWGSDYDCSSLVISAYEQAGVPVKEAGATYTGNMRAAFQKCGFSVLFYRLGMTLLRGDILLNERRHTAMYIGDGQIVQASIAETGKIYGKEGDQTQREIEVKNFYVYRYGWDYILRYEEKESEDIIVNVELKQIQFGAKCTEVGTLQTLLNALEFKGKNGKILTTDHEFGQNVDYAVRLFQKSVDLTPDGIVGPKTWDRLLKSNY